MEGVTDTVGEGLTVADELDAVGDGVGVGSGISGFGSSSEHAPSRHVASSVATARRVRIMLVHPRERAP